jgi:hypothetical protein
MFLGGRGRSIETGGVAACHRAARPVGRGHRIPPRSNGDSRAGLSWPGLARA